MGGIFKSGIPVENKSLSNGLVVPDNDVEKLTTLLIPVEECITF